MWGLRASALGMTNASVATMGYDADSLAKIAERLAAVRITVSVPARVRDAWGAFDPDDVRPWQRLDKGPFRDDPDDDTGVAVPRVPPEG